MSLASLIADVESGGDPLDFRFEHHRYLREEMTIKNRPPLLQTIALANSGCSWHTAAMIASCSWGKYQIMGFNLYGPVIRYVKHAMLFLMNGLEQDEAFGLLTNHMGIANFTESDILDNEAARRLVAAKWNGPGNVNEYAERLLTAACIRKGTS